MKLKTLHADELKYITEMNGHEMNLFKSKIKELEGIIAHRRENSPFVSQMNSSFLGEKTPPGSHLNSRHYSNPGLSRCSPPTDVKNSSNEKEKERLEYEQNLAKLRRVMNQNLTNHKEATDRLKNQLKEANETIKLKEDDNKQL